MDKKVLVAGCGKSGICAAGLLLRNNREVIIYDENKEGKVDAAKVRGNFLEESSIEVVLGELTDELLDNVDLMVLSPGIACDAPFVNRVREKGIKVWGEIEIAYYYNKGNIAAITGTNGKTTTTTLVGDIFKAYRDTTLVVGNIGTPFAKLADITTPDYLIAAEISSFQLETIENFRPHVSAVLNITPDHLYRHYTFDNYAKVKFDITMNQTEDDFCVLNYDDPETLKRKDMVKAAKIIPISKTEKHENGVYVDNGYIVVDDNGNKVQVMKVSDIKLVGEHNVENYLAAIAITYYMGVPVDVINKVCSEFMGVAHRIEFVREINGVEYFNDSKGTNVDAAIKAIKAMQGPTFLIAGGRGKGAPYDEMIEEFKKKARFLVVFGEDKDTIALCSKDHGYNNIMHVESLNEAVEFCHKTARAGDKVLLSPACASFDMYSCFEERGDAFKECVRKLEE